MMSPMIAKWLIRIVAVIAALAAVYFAYQHVQNLKLKAVQADARSERYAAALQAYQTQFADQVKAMNAEKKAEILRQESLLKTFNLIGDLPDAENVPVPAGSAAIIGSMYDTAKE